jgi:RNA polymerase sigma-70 factor (ECF subfamily)
VKGEIPLEGKLDEQHLVSRVLAREPTAEREFYDAHVDRVYRLAYRITGDAAMAEDVTQDTFLRAFSRLSGFRAEASLSTWLHSIALSVTLSALRKTRRLQERETNPGNGDCRRVTDPPQVELKISLSRAINGLSEKLRLVFLMHDLEGYKHEEIAEILDIEVGTSKARLSRAREQLREAMA